MAGADVEGQNQMAEGNWENKFKLAKLKLALCAVILLIAAILLFAAGTNIALWQNQDKLTNEKECLQKQVDELTGKLVEFQAKFNVSIEQLLKERDPMNGQLVEKVEGEEIEEENMKKAQTILEEQKMASLVKFARVIGVPNMVNIEGNYNRQKLLSLIKHGNSITPQIYYINWYHRLVDSGFVESIVHLLATTEEPAKMVREVVIEDYYAWFNWPQNSELKLKRTMSNVDIKLMNETAQDESEMAEYELANGGWHFQVLIYYWRKEDFNRSFVKFIYRRLSCS